MKTPLIAISALLLAGCESSRTNTRLTAEQARALSVQLANDKAEAVFHRRPFENKQQPQFENGRWIWTASQGVGTLDYQATVELAANGSTNNVDVRLTDDALHPQMVVPNDGPPAAPIAPYFRK
jgi:hypothetical protein